MYCKRWQQYSQSVQMTLKYHVVCLLSHTNPGDMNYDYVTIENQSNNAAIQLRVKLLPYVSHRQWLVL